MVIDDLLREQKISRYKLSKMSGVPQTTISDICNSKVDIENCNVSPMYKKVRVEECKNKELLLEFEEDYPNVLKEEI